MSLDKSAVRAGMARPTNTCEACGRGYGSLTDVMMTHQEYTTRGRVVEAAVYVAGLAQGAPAMPQALLELGEAVRYMEKSYAR